MAIRLCQWSITSWELDLNAQSKPNQDSDSFLYSRKIDAVETSSWVLCAMCVANYSNKVAALLAAEKHLAFPLNQASQLAIATPMKHVASAVICLPSVKQAPRSPNRRVQNRNRSDIQSVRQTCRFPLENFKTQRNGVLGCQKRSYGYLGRLPPFLGPVTYVTGFRSHRPRASLFNISPAAILSDPRNLGTTIIQHCWP